LRIVELDERSVEDAVFGAARHVADALPLPRRERDDEDEPGDVRGVGGGSRDHRAELLENAGM
jgi:hypothetical protein